MNSRLWQKSTTSMAESAMIRAPASMQTGREAGAEAPTSARRLPAPDVGALFEARTRAGTVFLQRDHRESTTEQGNAGVALGGGRGEPDAGEPSQPRGPRRPTRTGGGRRSVHASTSEIWPGLDQN